MMLAFQGWQRASKAVWQGKHAKHIHNNCRCEFAVRFDEISDVEGYEPEKYKKIYDNMPGENSNEKMKALRRMFEKHGLTIQQLDFIIDLERDGGILGSKTPAEWKKYLESIGFKTKTLGKGSLKGLKFEAGGGFRINYRGDGYLQYHPEGHHHHDSYYKRSNAKQGVVRLNLDGSRRDD